MPRRDFAGAPFIRSWCYGLPCVPKPSAAHPWAASWVESETSVPIDFVLLRPAQRHHRSVVLWLPRTQVFVRLCVYSQLSAESIRVLSDPSSRSIRSADRCEPVVYCITVCWLSLLNFVLSALLSFSFPFTLTGRVRAAEARKPSRAIAENCARVLSNKLPLDHSRQPKPWDSICSHTCIFLYLQSNQLIISVILEAGAGGKKSGNS